MAYKEDLGKVVGEKGDTGDSYTPVVTDNHNGTVTFTFNKNTNPPQSTTVEYPYVRIQRTNDQIQFINPDGTITTSIDLVDLKGADGHISIKNVATLPSINNADLDTIYIVAEPDNDGNNKLNSKLSAYIIYTDDNGNKTWEMIEQVIDLDNYYTKSEMDTTVQNINNTIDARLNCIIGQQQLINQTLTGGIALDASELPDINSVINILNGEQVEELKTEIKMELEEYIRERELNIALDDGDGIVSLVIDKEEE